MAYRAMDKLVVRGGFSKLYMLSPVSPGPSSPGDGPFGATTNILSTVNGINPNVTLDNPFPNGFQTPLYNSQGLSTLVGTSLNIGSSLGKTPYQYQWNIGFQYELPAKTIVSVAYAGTRGHDLTCGFFYCGDQIRQSLIQQYGSKVLSTVANPFYGIITDPLSALSLRQFNSASFSRTGQLTLASLTSCPLIRDPCRIYSRAATMLFKFKPISSTHMG